MTNKDMSSDTNKLDFDEAEYMLNNCIRITLNIETYTTEVNTSLNGENWIPVTEYVRKLIATKEAEAYKKGWAERGDYELRKYENVKD